MNNRNVIVYSQIFMMLITLSSCYTTMMIPCKELKLQQGDKIISYVENDEQEKEIPVTKGKDKFSGAYVYLDTLFIRINSQRGQTREISQDKIPLSDIRSLELKRYNVKSTDKSKTYISDLKFRKHIFYIEGESGLVLGNTSVNFERIFLPEKPFHFSLKGGFGIYYRYEEPDYYFFKSSYGYIYKLNSYLIWEGGFEIGFGISLLNCWDCSHLEENPWSSDYKIHPIISLGWRLQNKPFFFKTHGGSWGLGLCFGYSF